MARAIVVVTRFGNGAYVATFIYPSDFTKVPGPDFNVTPSVILGTNATAADIPGLDPSEVLPTEGFTKVFAIGGL